MAAEPRCPPRAAAWLLAHPEARTAEAAAALGLALPTIRHYRSILITAGQLPRQHRWTGHTPLDLDRLRESIEDGAASAGAARAQGLTLTALCNRLKRRGLKVDDFRVGQVFSGRELAKILCVTRQTAARWLGQWRDAGLIVAQRAKRRTSPWRLPVTEWIAFLERADCPLDPARIADPEWRAFAEDARRRPRSEDRNRPKKGRKISA